MVQLARPALHVYPHFDPLQLCAVLVDILQTLPQAPQLLVVLVDPQPESTTETVPASFPASTVPPASTGGGDPGFSPASSLVFEASGVGAIVAASVDEASPSSAPVGSVVEPVAASAVHDVSPALRQSTFWRSSAPMIAAQPNPVSAANATRAPVLNKRCNDTVFFCHAAEVTAKDRLAVLGVETLFPLDCVGPTRQLPVARRDPLVCAPMVSDAPTPPPPQATPYRDPGRASDAADSERAWLETVYKGDGAQLTWRAVVSGMLLGAVMCLSNLYVVLKTGWSIGVTVTACILGFGLFRMLRATNITRTPLSLLENNTIGSVASAAGYMTGGGNMAALPALVMLTGGRPGTWSLILWFAVIAAMGVFAAIPIKRQLVNREKLPFPTGTAAAETLVSMHAEGASNEKARTLAWAGLFGGLLAWMRDAHAKFMIWNLPDKVTFPFSYAGYPAVAWTVALEGSLVLVGAGALMGFKTGWSLLVGAAFTYGYLAPEMLSQGVIHTVSYKGIMTFMLWPGAAMLLSSGLLSFAFQWRSVASSFTGLARLLSRKPENAEREADPVAAVECPDWWFPAGFAALSPIIIALMAILFGIPVWAGIVAIPLSLVMGVVAARVTGETDVTPTKALGPVTQFVFGALLPGNLTANLMSANVTGGVGLHAADLLTDLKAGYLVGANPRKQFIAQMFGVLAGAAAIVPVFNILVPTPDVLGSAKFPAPGVQVWAGVSKALVDGVSSLPIITQKAALFGFVAGIVLVIAERWAPPRLKRFVPSASGLGLSLVLPAWNSISMFVGAAIAEAVRRRNAQAAERFIVPVASGFIAGESIIGVVVAILVAFEILQR